MVSGSRGSPEAPPATARPAAHWSPSKQTSPTGARRARISSSMAAAARLDTASAAIANRLNFNPFRWVTTGVLVDDEAARPWPERADGLNSELANYTGKWAGPEPEGKGLLHRRLRCILDSRHLLEPSVVNAV